MKPDSVSQGFWNALWNAAAWDFVKSDEFWQTDAVFYWPPGLFSNSQSAKKAKKETTISVGLKSKQV